MAHNLVEEIRVSGRELAERIRHLVKEGNVRRITIINREGETIFSLPLALGVAGAGGAFALAPVLSSITAFALLTNDVRMLVERQPEINKTGLKNRLRKKKDPADNPYDKDPFELEADFEIME